MVLKREVNFPIFLKCLSIAEDLFWKEIFEDFSYGVCYNGTYISKGFLCSNLKGREFMYRFLDKNDPKKLYNDITKILKEKLNIMSNNDRKKLIEELETIESNLRSIKNVEWSCIKKKSIRDILFQNFLINMKNIHHLTDSQIKKIYNFINLGLMLKSIKNSDITYEDGEIKNITGIDFFKNKYILDIDIYSGLDDDCSKIYNKKDKKLLSTL